MTIREILAPLRVTDLSADLRAEGLTPIPIPTIRVLTTGETRVTTNGNVRILTVSENTESQAVKLLAPLRVTRLLAEE